MYLFNNDTLDKENSLQFVLVSWPNSFGCFGALDNFVTGIKCIFRNISVNFESTEK